MTPAPSCTLPARRTRARGARRFLAAVVAAASLATVTGAALAPASASTRPGPTAPKAAPATVDQPNPYVGQVACDPTTKPGAKALADLLLAHYKTGRYGIVRDCGTGGRSEHKEGRAIDWMLDASDPTQAAVAGDFLGWLTAAGPDGQPGYQARRLGVMYVIWNRQTWATYRPEWRAYTGVSPHTDHIHISLGWNGAMKRTSWWTGSAAAVDYGPCITVHGQSIAPYVGPNPSPCPPLAPPAPPVTSEPQPVATVVPTATVTHTVVSGDTLWNIASRYGTTVTELRSLNGLTSDQIRLGQVLKIASGTPRFTDVSATHPFAVEIAWLASRRITSGVGDGSQFDAGGHVERQQMAGFLHRLSGESYSPPRTPTFTDMPSSRGLFASVEWLVAEGITKGVGSGRFDPLGSIQRQHMAAFLFRMSGDTGYKPPATSAFSDVPTSHPFYREISWLAQRDISRGVGGGRFDTESPVERQHMAAFLHRFDRAVG